MQIRLIRKMVYNKLNGEIGDRCIYNIIPREREKERNLRERERERET